MTPAYYNSIASRRHTRSAAHRLLVLRNEQIGEGENPNNETDHPHSAFDSLDQTGLMKSEV